MTHEIAVEAHGTHATLYLTGMIGVAQVTAAIVACERLPRHVRTLRIDWQAPDGADGDLYHLGRLLALWYARGGDGAWTVSLRPSLLSGRGTPRQPHGDRGSLADDALRGHGTPVRVGQVSHDRQPEPGATVLA